MLGSHPCGSFWLLAISGALLSVCSLPSLKCLMGVVVIAIVIPFVHYRSSYNLGHVLRSSKNHLTPVPEFLRRCVCLDSVLTCRSS